MLRKLVGGVIPACESMDEVNLPDPTTDATPAMVNR